MRTFIDVEICRCGLAHKKLFSYTTKSYMIPLFRGGYWSSHVETRVQYTLENFEHLTVMPISLLLSLFGLSCLLFSAALFRLICLLRSSFYHSKMIYFTLPMALSRLNKLVYSLLPDYSCPAREKNMDRLLILPSNIRLGWK